MLSSVVFLSESQSDSDSDWPQPDSPEPAGHQEWILCVNCNTWRKVPASIHAASLSDTWRCSENSWNPAVAKCGIPQEPDEFADDPDRDEVYSTTAGQLKKIQESLMKAAESPPLPKSKKNRPTAVSKTKKSAALDGLLKSLSDSESDSDEPLENIKSMKHTVKLPAAASSSPSNSTPLTPSAAASASVAASTAAAAVVSDPAVPKKSALRRTTIIPSRSPNSFSASARARISESFSAILGQARGVELESQLFNLYRTQRDDSKYKAQFRELISNLKHPDNEELRKNIESGSLSLQVLVGMNSQQLAPNSLSEYREKIKVSALKQVVLEENSKILPPQAYLMKQTLTTESAEEMKKSQNLDSVIINDSLVKPSEFDDDQNENAENGDGASSHNSASNSPRISSAEKNSRKRRAPSSDEKTRDSKSARSTAPAESADSELLNFSFDPAAIMRKVESGRSNDESVANDENDHSNEFNNDFAADDDVDEISLPTRIKKERKEKSRSHQHKAEAQAKVSNLSTPTPGFDYESHEVPSFGELIWRDQLTSPFPEFLDIRCHARQLMPHTKLQVFDRKLTRLPWGDAPLNHDGLRTAVEPCQPYIRELQERSRHAFVIQFEGDTEEDRKLLHQLSAFYERKQRAMVFDRMAANSKNPAADPFVLYVMPGKLAALKFDWSYFHSVLHTSRTPIEKSALWGILVMEEDSAEKFSEPRTEPIDIKGIDAIEPNNNGKQAIQPQTSQTAPVPANDIRSSTLPQIDPNALANISSFLSKFMNNGPPPANPQSQPPINQTQPIHNAGQFQPAPGFQSPPIPPPNQPIHHQSIPSPGQPPRGYQSIPPGPSPPAHFPPNGPQYQHYGPPPIQSYPPPHHQPQHLQPQYFPPNQQHPHHIPHPQHAMPQPGFQQQFYPNQPQPQPMNSAPPQQFRGPQMQMPQQTNQPIQQHQQHPQQQQQQQHGHNQPSPHQPPSHSVPPAVSQPQIHPSRLQGLNLNLQTNVPAHNFQAAGNQNQFQLTPPAAAYSPGPQSQPHAHTQPPMNSIPPRPPVQPIQPNAPSFIHPSRQPPGRR